MDELRKLGNVTVTPLPHLSSGNVAFNLLKVKTYRTGTQDHYFQIAEFGRPSIEMKITRRSYERIIIDGNARKLLTKQIVTL